MIFSKFFNFFEKYFFEKSSRMKDLIFAAIFKSTSRIFFHLENPEISAVLDPKLVGGSIMYQKSGNAKSPIIDLKLFRASFLCQKERFEHSVMCFRRPRCNMKESRNQVGLYLRVFTIFGYFA